MFADGFTFELNWDVNSGQAVKDLDRIEDKLNQVDSAANQAAAGVKKGFGANLFSGFNQSLGNMGNSLKGAVANVGQMTAGMSPLGGSLMSVGAAAGGVALGVAAVGAAFVAGAFAAGRMADELQDLADKLNVTTDFLQVTQGVMTLTTGSADSLAKGILKLDEAYGNALGGDKGAAGKFAQLGIELTDAAGNAKSSEVIFAETTDALRDVENTSQRAALAAELFGKAGKEMGGYLSKSREEIDALENQIKKYGVASASAIQASGKLGDGMDLLGQTMRAGIINAFAPIANALGNLAVKIMPILGEAFRVLGGVIDLIAGQFSVFGDILKLVWDAVVAGAQFIGQTFPWFQQLGQWLNFTGEAGLSLRERWAMTMGGIIQFSATMAGRVAGYFAGLAANVHNLLARIKNAIVDSGIGKLIGMNGRMEIRDASAASQIVQESFEGWGREQGAAFTARYRGSGNRREAAADPGGGAIRNMGGGGGGGAAAAAAAAAQQTDKYAEAVARLEQAKAELLLTDEEKRILDEMERAGLARDLTLMDEKAVKIRELVAQLADMEQQKKVTEMVTEYQQAVRETTMSEEELVRVEARRRAGLTLDLTVTNERIQQLEDAALAADRAAKAQEKLRSAEGELNDMRRETRDLEWELREARATDEELYEIRLEQIEEERAAEEDRLRQQYAGLEVLEQLIEANNRLAQARKDVVLADEANETAEKAQEQAEELADTLVDMWDDWQGTMKRVLGDFIRELLVAIAKATILKNIMKDTQMGGSSGGNGSIGSILANAVMSAFGGGRAAGGPMEAGVGYLVTPGEKFVPATDGYMLSANDLRRMQGGGGKTINMGGITYNINGGGDTATTLAAIQESENNLRMIVRDELARA